MGLDKWPVAKDLKVLFLGAERNCTNPEIQKCGKTKTKILNKEIQKFMKTEIEKKTINSSLKEPHNNPLDPTSPLSARRSLTQTPRRTRGSTPLNGLRVSGALYGPRNLEMKIEIVWPSAIGEARNWENTFLRLPPKLGSDSSDRPSVWPSANGGSEQRKRNAHLQRHPKIGPDSSVRSIVRPSAVGETKKDQHLC
jgi:hypothetical protein